MRRWPQGISKKTLVQQFRDHLFRGKTCLIVGKHAADAVQIIAKCDERWLDDSAGAALAEADRSA